MNGMGLSAVTGFLALWTGACMASSPSVIQFQGSIVGIGCAAMAQVGELMELNGCPLASRESQFMVRPVGSVKALGNAIANVRLVADSGTGRYYKRRYMLVDGLGRPIQSGSYVITMTSP